ncbi:colicin E5-related ribonuclease [Campylobacter majalis]|uniref:colicin E5-related ribonuclease n=1 Tax=Campylobacter majalis TaxID=2790656 RepID=UPI003D6804CB
MKFTNQLITLFISLNLIISQSLFANLSPIKTNKDLYSTNISSNVDTTIDTRLFSKDGREQVKQEYEQIKNGIKLLAFNIIYKDEIKEVKEFQENFINKLIKLKNTDIQKYNEVVNELKEFSTKKENLKEQGKTELGPGILAVPPILVWFSSYLNAPTNENEIYSGPTETTLLTPIGVVGKTSNKYGVINELKFSNVEKITKQMKKRGWTEKEIVEAMQTKGIPTNGKNGPATRYVHPKTGKSVVVDNKTNEIFHVGDKGFKYDY